MIMPIIKPYLYSNGGPIILMQFENEYGNFGIDSEYIANLITAISEALAGQEGVNLFHV